MIRMIGKAVSLPAMEKEVPISSISMRCMISATKNIQIYGSKKNESRALVQMLENIKSPAKTIILADRGYETYHVFAHIMAKGLAFVIRTKDISRKGGIAYGFRLPDRELDKDGKQAVYPMKLRMVRFLLDTGEYECIVTNLKREEFPPWRIRELYHLRWGICAFLSPIH